MPLARRQVRELRAELVQALSPGVVVRGTVVAWERFRARAPIGEAGPPEAAPLLELACYSR